MDAMRIYAGDWRQALSQMKGEERRFDLVFLDPPYRMPVLEECCAALADLGLLEADALLVLEHRLDAVPSPDGRFALWKDRAYGDTDNSFFSLPRERVGQEETDVKKGLCVYPGSFDP